MKIVIISGSRPWMLALAGRLADALGADLAGIVVEETDSWPNRFRQLGKRLRRYGLIATIDQVLLQLYLLGARPEGELSAAVEPQLRTESVNDPRVADFLRRMDADLVINIGGGIMKEAVFKIPRLGVVNIHPGICPRYRGANANFWAILERNFTSVGVTVHRVDEGIDTGEILLQRTVEVVPGRDTLESITHRAYETGVEGVIGLVESFRHSGTFPEARPQEGEGRTYGWYGLRDYLRVKRILNEGGPRPGSGDVIRSRFAQLGKDSFVYGVGGAISKAVAFLLLPVYTRLFTPAQYGAIELLASLNTFMAAVMVLGMDSAQSYFFFERKKEDRRAQNEVVSAALEWRLAWGGAVVVLATLLSPWLNHLIFDGKLDWRYFALSFLGALFTQILSQSADVFRLLYRPWGYVAVTLAGSLLSAAVILILVAAFDGGILGYLIGLAAGSAIAAAAGWIALREHLDLSRWHSKLFAALIRFGLPLMPSGVVMWIMNTADRWFLNAYHSDAAVGLYAVGAKFAMGVTLLTENFRRAWWPMGMETLHNEEGPELYRAVSRLYLGGGLALVVLIAGISPWLVKWFAAPQYFSAYPVVGVLSFASVFYGFLLIACAGTWKAKQTGWTTAALLAGAALNVGLNALWVPAYGGIGAAAATSLSMLVANIILIVRGERLWRIGFSWGLLGAQVVIAALCVAGALFLYMRGSMLRGALVAAAGTAVLAVISAHPEAREFLRRRKEPR